MTTKEINIDDLLNNHDAGRPAKTNKDAKKSKYDDDWEENDDNNGGFGFTTVTKTSKAKTKKKVADKGWTDDAEAKPATPVAEVTKIEQPQETTQKKGIFKKPTGETVSKPKVDVQEEYFPTLGEEAPKNIPKKRVEPTTPPQSDSKTAQASGPRRFVNAAKKGAGENFVPLDPTLTEKVVPERVVKTETTTEKPVERATEKPAEKPAEKPVEYKDIAPKGFFSRNEKSVKELEASAQAAEAQQETKFKFGGEGPKKFTAGSKISFKREEEKNEQESLREQREREIEEKLQKEREEAAKAREHKKPREFKEGEKPEGQEEKRKFVNSKKDTTEKPAPRKISADKPIEEPKEEKIVAAKEVIEVHGSLSTIGWGEGGDIKKKATTTTAAKK